MTLVIPPGFAEIAVEMRSQGDPDPWYCTWGVDVSDAGGDIEAVGYQNNDAWTRVMVSLATIVTQTGCYVTMGQDGGENIRQFVPWVPAQAGSTPGAKLPQNCALLVRKNTGAGGRRSRGRLFIPSIVGEGGVDNVGVIANDQLADLQGKITTFFGVLTETVEGGTPTPMVLLHSTGISSVTDPTPVTSLVCDSVISTQRRRLR